MVYIYGFGLLACVYVHHVHAVPTEIRKGDQDPRELELERVVTYCES